MYSNAMPLFQASGADLPWNHGFYSQMADPLQLMSRSTDSLLTSVNLGII